MKRTVLVFLLILSLCLSGCDLWMDGNYYSVTPHLSDNIQPEQGSVLIKSYTQLQSAMLEMVGNGSTNGVLYVTEMTQEQLETYMGIAKRSVMADNAIGAYAVKDISFEIGTNTGRLAVALEISYNHGRSEILRIKQTNSMAEAIDVITKSLENCDAGVVLQVDQFEPLDFTQLVQDYVDSHPQRCMEMPQVAVAVYPNSGAQRVVEITYTYQTSRETLRSMQDTVRPIFSSAELYVSVDTENWEKYAQLYSFLMGRDTYTVETSITPSYSLLRHGVGDSKAFATVYAAMCKQADLDCHVVSGTKSGESWYWNVVLEDGVYYHIDLLQCSQDGGFLAKKDEEMTGYVWDYSAYVQEKDKANQPVVD